MRRYRGHAGHYICAERCLFHLHTEVPGFKVSSVGNYRPDLNKRNETAGRLAQIGAGYYYETMVFCLGADGKELFPGRCVEALTYLDETAAERGHELLCARYEALSPAQVAAVHARVKRGEEEP